MTRPCSLFEGSEVDQNVRKRKNPGETPRWPPPNQPLNCHDHIGHRAHNSWFQTNMGDSDAYHPGRGSFPFARCARLRLFRFTRRNCFLESFIIRGGGYLGITPSQQKKYVRNDLRAALYHTLQMFCAPTPERTSRTQVTRTKCSNLFSAGHGEQNRHTMPCSTIDNTFDHLQKIRRPKVATISRILHVVKRATSSYVSIRYMYTALRYKYDVPHDPFLPSAVRCKHRKSHELHLVNHEYLDWGLF